MLLYNLYMAQGKAYTEEQRASIIESLKPYLELGFSRNKSCNLIGLDPTTLSKWVQADEALSMKLEGWENAINKLALSNIRDAIQKEGELEDTRKETTKWWIERKMKQEFSLRTEQTGADGKELPQPILNAYVLNNDKSKENSKDVQEDTSSTGGDISIEDNINPIVVDSVVANRPGEEADISSIGIDSTLETRSDERLQEHNDGSSILEGFELERNG